MFTFAKECNWLRLKVIKINRRIERGKDRKDFGKKDFKHKHLKLVNLNLNSCDL